MLLLYLLIAGPALLFAWPAAYLAGSRHPLQHALAFAVLSPWLGWAALYLITVGGLQEPALWTAAAVALGIVILLKCWRLRSSAVVFDRGDEPLPRRLR